MELWCESGGELAGLANSRLAEGEGSSGLVNGGLLIFF